MRWRWLIVLASLLGCVACGSVISPQVRQSVDPQLSYAQMAAQPEAYMGKVLIVAGILLRP